MYFFYYFIVFCFVCISGVSISVQHFGQLHEVHAYLHLTLHLEYSKPVC